MSNPFVNWTPQMVEAHNQMKTAKQHNAEQCGESTLTQVSQKAKGNRPTFSVTVIKSTDEEKLNKTEQAYLAYLRSLKPQWLGIQNITLKMADDTRYTPDFFAIDSLGVLHAREVKGFWRDDAKVKIKVAARQFPWIRFTVAVKDGNYWKHTQVKP